MVASKRLTYTVNGAEFKFADETNIYVNAMISRATKGKIITITVGEEVRKYSLWRDTKSGNAFMFDGADYVCVEAVNCYKSSYDNPVLWNVGEFIITSDPSTSRLVPLEDQ